MDSDKTSPDMKIDPKYAEPYPQAFYRFWPRHVIMVVIIAGAFMGLLFWLANQYPLPTDQNMPPMPDEGAYIPAPEWYLFMLFQPFWYLTGDNAWLRPLGTFWLPLLILIGLVALPFVFGRKRAAGGRMKLLKRLGIGLIGLVVWTAGMAAVGGSGYPAKTNGCISCHNPMMGVRQALPPSDMGKFYREKRQQQIEVGRYRIGNTMGMGDSYKDANWQLRHFYEPTMTW